ncbi:MAG: ABC transporter substrate-binding protein [Anaerolineae bacterium]
MRSSRTRFVLLTLVILLSLVLSACGPAATPAPATATTAPAQPAPAATAVPPTATAAPAPTAVPPTATAAPAATKAPAPTAAPAAGQKILRRAQSVIGKFGDPFHITGGQIDEWMFFAMSRLVFYDAKLDLQPDIAEKYTVSPDGKTYTFTLRKGVEWHDGKPFTAKDVVFTFNYICQKDLNAMQYPNIKVITGCKDVNEGKATTVSGVTANGDYEVTFKLDNASSIFNHALTQIPIVPEHVVKDIPPADFTKSKFVTERWYPGTGPFIVKEFKGDESIEFVANPKYFRGAPKIDVIRDIKIPDANTRLLALEKGEVDIALGLPVAEMDRIKKIPGVQLVYLDPVVPNILFVNYHAGNKEGDKPEQPKFKPMRDPKFRQALVHALDLDNLVKAVDPSGLTVKWNCPLAPSLGDLCPKDLPTYAYDPEKAKALLKEIGWDPNWELTFVALGTPPTWYEIVQQMWAKVGIKATITPIEFANFIAEFYNKGKFDVIISGQARWVPLDILGTAHRCGYEYPKGYNATQYCNPKFDEVFEKAQNTADPAVYKPLITEMTRILNTDLPTYPLWIGKSFQTMGAKVDAATFQLGCGYNWTAPHTWALK